LAHASFGDSEKKQRRNFASRYHEDGIGAYLAT